MITEFAFFEEFEMGTLLPLAGLLIGVLFGVVAQRSRFCLRSTIAGETRQARITMAGVYAAALATALVGAQALAASGLLDLEATRFVSDSLPVGALALGGLMFGAGMILTRGCVSRLTVLGGQGNLRALMVLLVFGITAYATLRGVLALPRVALTDATSVAVESTALAPAAGIILLLTALAVAWRSGAGVPAPGRRRCRRRTRGCRMVRDRSIAP